MKNIINLSLLLTVGLFCVFGCVPPRERSEIKQPVKNQEPQLKLLSSRGEIGRNLITITGEVQNISTEKIESLWVVVSLYDKDDQLITTEDSVVEYTPLMPGQTTPFKSLVRVNPLMKIYKIGFREGLSGQIDYIDARSEKPTKAKPEKK